MAASIAVQNRDIQQERARNRTDLLLAVTTARHVAKVADMEQMLHGLAALLARAGPVDACRRALDTAMALASPRPTALLVVQADGGVACESPRPRPGGIGEWAAPATLRSLFLAARDQPLQGALPDSIPESIPGYLPVWRVPAAPPPPSAPVQAPPTLAAAVRVPAATDGAAAGGPTVLVATVAPRGLAGLAVGPTLPGAAAWLVGPGNRLLSLVADGQAPGAEPDATALPALLDTGRADTIVRSRSGRPYAYTSGDLPGGLRVLVGAPATADLLRADLTLRSRLLELGAFLLGGLLAMAIGAHLAVVRPIRHLSAAVHVWRNGGAFSASHADGAPREVVELARTFGEATTALRTREVELRTSSAHQDLLMQEIHHRVKNNLQIVASLLNLQASRIRQPQARAEFQAARDRIRALATLHRHLYAHGELQTINMRAFLHELCGQLLQAIGETPDGGRIQLDITAPELQITSDRAVPFALIVTEAVSNSAKYAFPGGRSGHITVSVEPIESASPSDPEAVRLLIQDNGIGIPAGQADTETGVRDGIGIQLIRGFARQLGATLEITHEDGTRFELEIPLHRERQEPESLERVTEPA